MNNHKLTIKVSTRHPFFAYCFYNITGIINVAIILSRPNLAHTRQQLDRSYLLSLSIFQPNSIIFDFVFLQTTISKAWQLQLQRQRAAQAAQESGSRLGAHWDVLSVWAPQAGLAEPAGISTVLLGPYFILRIWMNMIRISESTNQIFL